MTGARRAQRLLLHRAAELIACLSWDAVLHAPCALSPEYGPAATMRPLADWAHSCERFRVATCDESETPNG